MPPLPKTILISFSGIDGAGKSTQITNLRRVLEQDGFRVNLITFWDEVARLKPIREGAGHKLFKGDAGVGSPEIPIERKDKNVRSPFMTLVRLGLYLVDAFSLREVANRALGSNADVVIFDRFLWDELANLNLNSSLMRFYVRMIAKLVPRPQISFILDADPEQARARKPEYPLEWLRVNRNAYLALSGLLGGFTVISPLPLQSVKEEIAACVAAIMGPQSLD